MQYYFDINVWLFIIVEKQYSWTTIVTACQKFLISLKKVEINEFPYRVMNNILLAHIFQLTYFITLGQSVNCSTQYLSKTFWDRPNSAQFSADMLVIIRL